MTTHDFQLMTTTTPDGAEQAPACTKITSKQREQRIPNNARHDDTTRWALVSLSLAALLSSLGTSITNVGLPTLVKAFDASFQQVQWVVLAYLLAITTLIVSAGRLGDLFGRRRMLLVGIALFAMASVFCALAPSLRLLIAARVLQGLGAALMMSLAMSLVGESIPKEKTGSAMGILGTVSAIGTALGPSLGGVLIEQGGWPLMFLINTPLGVLAWLLAQRFLPIDRPTTTEAKPRFDVLGTVLLTLTLAAYALAMTLGRGHFGALNLSLLIAASVSLGLFIRSQMKASSPLIRLSLFRNPALTLGFAMSTLVTTVVMATLVVGPFYLAGAMALDAGQVGLVMASGPVMAALVGTPAGRIVDRLGAQRMILAGLLAMFAGAALLSLLPVSLGVSGYVLPLMVLTAGYALFQAANNTTVMTHLTEQQRGVGAGLLGLSRNLGLITGASLMGMIFALGADVADITAASSNAIGSGMRLTFGVAATMIIGALALGFLGHLRSHLAVDAASAQKKG